jgi:hypothetical protein
MTAHNFDDLGRLLRRAKARDERAQAEEVGDLLAGLFARSQETSIARVTGSDAAERERLDRVRSENDRARHNALEERRLLGGSLTEDEERELADLRARRNASGYYRPAEDGAQ